MDGLAATVATAPSPYFRLPDTTVCSVRYPADGRDGWIMWNWEKSTWDHMTTAEREDIKDAERLAFGLPDDI